MKTMKQNIILAIFILFGASTMTCIGQNNIYSITFIKHGTSFGECSGYCYHETKYDSSMITSYSKSWGKGPNNKIPDKLDTLIIDKNKWNSIIKSINLIEFNKLPTTIGCPDCTDGGAEWIEIGTRDKIYKVEFEYGVDIKAITELLKLLRQEN